MKEIRLDFIFTYWIFTWYVLYSLRIVSVSPKLVLCIAVLSCAISFVVLLYRRIRPYNLIKFFSMNMILKFLPLYTLMSQDVSADQVIASLLVAIVYITYVNANNGSVYDTYKQLYYQHNGDTDVNKTPTSILYNNTFMI